jgi:hypothetical protein
MKFLVHASKLNDVKLGGERYLVKYKNGWVDQEGWLLVDLPETLSEFVEEVHAEGRFSIEYPEEIITNPPEGVKFVLNFQNKYD